MDVLSCINKNLQSINRFPHNLRQLSRFIRIKRVFERLNKRLTFDLETIPQNIITRIISAISKTFSVTCNDLHRGETSE